MFSRISIFLSKDELNALRSIAEREYRDIRSQVAFIVRQELESRGLMSPQPESRSEPASQPKVEHAAQR